MRAGTVVVLACLTACKDPGPDGNVVRRERVTVVNLDLRNDAAEYGCGGHFSSEPLRNCARLGEPRRYAGTYLRHIEGGSFREGVPGPYEARREFALSIDGDTRDAARLPDYRPRYSVDLTRIEFIGRRVLDRTSDPANFGAPSAIVVDRVLSATSIPAADMPAAQRRAGLQSD
jgi:hypothetical protein